MKPYILLGQLAPRLLSIRKSTWIGLGIGLLMLIGLLAWAAFAVLSWLWGQAPNAAEAGKRVADTALAQVEQVAPGVKEQVAAWLPSPKGNTNKSEPVARDVSGLDVGPVTRYTGLARDYYHREGRIIEVRYLGRADFKMVLDHYAQGFASAGWKQEILSATREHEQQRYTLGNEQIDFRLTSLPDGLVQVELKDTL